jgi:hypothetical protein
MSTASPFLKVLLGTGCFGVLGAWEEKTGGAAVAGHHCFVTSPLLLFLFFLGMCFAVAPAFSLFELLHRCDCYITIAGRKPISRLVYLSNVDSLNYLLLRKSSTAGSTPHDGATLSGLEIFAELLLTCSMEPP